MAPNPSVILSLDDLEQAAMPLAAKQARDYWQSGANEMISVRENIAGYDRYRIRSRVMRNVANVDPSPKSTLFGREYAYPIGIAPSAFHQMACQEGETDTARAAQNFNIPMGLSSYSNRSYADVKEAGGDSAVFFQLYIFENRKTTEALVKKVEEAGYKALALTVDTPFLGQRYPDHRNNFKLPGHLSLGNFDATNAGPVDVLIESTSDSRAASPEEKAEKEEKKSDAPANVLDPSICWEETIPWLRSITNLEIWVKGVATSEDAELAVQAGVDGIWVSNHGGRQLDSTLATIDALPEVVEAVQGRVPVHVDGGIRRGGDVFKALALGADFVWVGRPALYGLQYDGQKGVELMNHIITSDFQRTMALAGCLNTNEITKKSLVRIGPAVTKL